MEHRRKVTDANAKMKVSKEQIHLRKLQGKKSAGSGDNSSLEPEGCEKHRTDYIRNMVFLQEHFSCN